ncbi:hypothetical protein PRIPAC_82872 [Pristionchus pacificus]|uniref:Uncharacterized protein n=1 Tax=Pristionchus pacificus TaxID=54126 RepID=A0A2A6BE02_PRIPA|nr:hypothetical protein PRIPAC_82872 [Pristionchus pacificus]|eukprot:PDM64109.1 hypothetical protein PRIPAC_54353 [Pristionchus pacificus]
MSDGVSETDISYGRLLALKKEHKKDVTVAKAIFKLAGMDPRQDEVKKCATFAKRALDLAEETKKKIYKGRSPQDKLFFLNSYCGIASHLGITFSLAPFPVDLSVPSRPIPSPPLVSPPVIPRKCGGCAARCRTIKNLSAKLGRARKNWLLRGKILIRRTIAKSKGYLLLLSGEQFSPCKGSFLSAENSRLATELRFSENARLESEESLAEQISRVVTLKFGQSYSADTVVTVLELLNLGVADEKIGGVMESVAKLTGVKLDRVPSPSTVRNIAIASLSVAKAHIHQRLDQAIDQGEQLCLYSDETNKLGSKLQCFGAGLVKENGGQEVLLFGLAQVADKSAQTAFDIMRNRLDSLSRGVSDCNRGNFTDRFFAAVSCVMSDSAATQQKFNFMIEEYRASVLPTVINGWEEMSDAQQHELLKFHVFYCQLHVIANYTNVVLEALAEHERLVTGREIPDLSPTVLSVVKEVARLFGDRSAGMHACSKEFKVWSGLDQTNCKSPFPSFLGHRFNVVFLLASRVFYHRQSLKQFIDERGSGRSELTKLGELLDLPIVVEHLHILLDQLVTGPLWRLAENVAHVMDTWVTVSLLLSWVRECRDTPSALFSGNCSVPSLHSIAAGDEQFLEKLLSVSPTETSLEAVALVMESSLRYFMHLFEDFIPGGKYSGIIDDVVVDRTRCAPATNRFIESAFGFVDRLFTHAPNMLVSRRESRLFISENHTMAWLSSKSSEERNAIVLAARASIGTIRAEEKHAKALLAEAILQKSLEKEKEYNAKVALQVKMRNQAVDAISTFGFIISVNSISALLGSSSETERANALVAQIRFRERALQQQPPEKGIFKLSNKGRKLTEDELKRRLVVLIEADQKGTLLTSSIDHPFIGRFVRRWKEEVSEDGRVSSVKKRGETPLVSIQFPSGQLTIPVSTLESSLDEGSFDLLDDLL